jgi:hypothetical protein
MKMLFLVVALFMSTVGLAQHTSPLPQPTEEYRKAHPPREDGDLELSIAAEGFSGGAAKERLIDVSVKNISSEPFWFVWTVGNNEGELNGFVIKVTDSAGQEIPLLPQHKLLKRSRGAYSLQPGQILYDHLDIDRLVGLTAPGEYKVQVKWKYRVSERWIQSNIISVVVPPKTA